MIAKGYLLGDRYRIIDTLGEGGMANVYLAKDIILQRKVAVKMLRFDLQKDPQTVQRFQREALSTSELSHPNIVSVFDVATDHGVPYMVMEYVDGPNLKQYIQDHGPLPLPQVISIMDQILSAVSLAHQHNVIHRDLKPQNILMDQHGTIKIADFGIALALSQTDITQTNTALGSVHYMSPEQARGGVVTKQSDIYSLGIILYELLAGKVPFGGQTAVSIALQHMRDQVPSLHKLNPDIPQSLDNVVRQATAKDPRDRFASVSAMKQALDQSLSPSMANAPVFQPLHDPTKEETIVLPQFNGKVISDDKKPAIALAGEPEQKSTLWDSIKKHKWWWLGSFLGMLLVLLLLVFAFGRSREVHVPDVSSLSAEKAESSLKTAGLKVGSKTYRYSSKVAKGKVIETSPASGKAVSQHKKIDLVIAKGYKPMRVPDVTNESYREARKELRKRGFKVVKEKAYSETVDKGYVITQSLTAGTKVKRPNKHTVRLSVSLGRRRGRPNISKGIKLRDLTGYTLRGVQDYANDNGLRLQITEKNSDDVAKKNVISQNPAVGTVVHRGDTISVVISKGPEGDQDSSQDSVTKTVSVQYDADNDQSGQGNHVQIYIADDNHSLNNIYRDLYIKSDQNFSIPFSLKHGSGHLRVVRDGQTVVDESVDHD
ncbi:MAG: Stk1 family PASTA domain-containing Ser/Thr kinase [Lactobacillus sp.]|nr:Stk1 family PASTA domain-containing Ser/Thr kinase [Lactobacillus sp.]